MDSVWNFSHALYNMPSPEFFRVVWKLSLSLSRWLVLICATFKWMMLVFMASLMCSMLHVPFWQAVFHLLFLCPLLTTAAALSCVNCIVCGLYFVLHSEANKVYSHHFSLLLCKSVEWRFPTPSISTVPHVCMSVCLLEVSSLRLKANIIWCLCIHFFSYDTIMTVDLFVYPFLQTTVKL